MKVMLEASRRIQAAMADEKAAITFLRSLSFKGLTLLSDADDRISFKYSEFNDAKLRTNLGSGKDTSTGNIIYKFGSDGDIILKPKLRIVVLKNSTAIKKFKVVDVPKEPERKDPEVHTKDLMPVRNFNDDNSVPHIALSPELYQEFLTCKMPDKTYRLRFMKNCWSYLNRTKFHGELKIPNLDLLRNTGKDNFRLRGHWIAGRRLLELSPRLFNAHVDFFVEIFLHEMCHQAVSEINKIREGEGGHGPVWSSWMRKVGLNPLRYDPRENTEYMSPREKELTKQSKDTFDNYQQERKQRDAIITHKELVRINPVEGMPAVVIYEGQALHGVIVCPASLGIVKRDQLWAFLKQDTDGDTTKHLKIKATNFYRYRNVTPGLFDRPRWQEVMKKIRDYYQSKGFA